MTITLEDLGSSPAVRKPGDFKRKGADGPPYVSCPNGERVKSGARKGELKWKLYGRPSGFAASIGNSFALLKWKERDLVYGFAVGRDGLSAEIDALLALERNRDDDTWRATADALVVRAYEFAETSLSADQGTHTHATTEDDDKGGDWVARAERGEALGIPRHVQAAMVEAWRLMLADTGMVVLAAELPIVHDGWQVAGTLDRIVLLTKDVTFVTTDGEVVTVAAGTVLVLDIKTGRMRTDRNGAVLYWLKYAVQIAAYNDGTPYDCDTDERSHWVDVLDNANDRDVVGEGGNLADNRWAIIAHLPVGEALAGKATCRLVLVDLDAGRDAADVVMRADVANKRTDVFHLAPAHEYTVDVVDPAEAIERIEDVFAGLPKADDKPFTPRPTPQRITAVAKPAGEDINDGEGPYATTQEVEAARKALRSLTGQPYERLNALYAAAAKAHPSKHGISLKVPSWRRVLIANALVELATAFPDHLDDETLRCIGVVILDAQQPAVELHDAYVALSTREAETFRDVARAVGAGQAALDLSDGLIAWSVPALAANPAA